MTQIASSKMTDELGDILTKLDSAQQEIKKVILGQDTVIRLSLSCILAGGHLIYVGVPGLAKTKLVHTIGSVMGLDMHRIQCTPDLMPADILGSEVLEKDAQGHKDFRFIEGPVFTQLLLADEINRASPRTQSALLEAMQERQVTVAGRARELPKPFHVLATQNPIEQEGTYPLPEAQLDRFLMQVEIDYPDEASERQILIATTSNVEENIKSVFTTSDILAMQRLVRDIPMGESVIDFITQLVRNCRPETTKVSAVKHYLDWGPGPRAGQAFMLAGRSLALLKGQEAPLIEDILDLAKPILRHRVGLSFKARADEVSVDEIIEKVCQELL